jgi:ribosome-binding factor A
MTRPRRSRRPTQPSGRAVPRTARFNELLREVIAEQLERIDDQRLEHVTITSVDVDADLNRAIVYYDALAGESVDEKVLEAFGAHRVRIQGAIGRQVRARKTPILQFRPDDVIRSAERIDRILRDATSPAEQEEDDAGPR